MRYAWNPRLLFQQSACYYSNSWRECYEMTANIQIGCSDLVQANGIWNKGRQLTGGVFADKSLFNLSVNPCIKELPPTTITLLYKLCKNYKYNNSYNQKIFNNCLFFILKLVRSWFHLFIKYQFSLVFFGWARPWNFYVRGKNKKKNFLWISCINESVLVRKKWIKP